MLHCNINPRGSAMCRRNGTNIDADEAFKTNMTYVKAHGLAYVYEPAVMRTTYCSECI